MPEIPDLTVELDAAEDDIVMGTVPPEVQALRDHIDRDHGIMVQLGRVADHALSMLEHVNMDTDEDRVLRARAVGALRGRLSEIAATMKETNDAARSNQAGGDAALAVLEAENDSAPAGAVKEDGGP